MNYTFQNRKQRSKHTFKPANVGRGVVYPTIKDFFNRLRNGEDLSRYLSDILFTGDTVFDYEDYLDLVQRNRVMLDQIVKLRDEVKDEDHRHEKVDEKDKDVKDADDEETNS